jgi:hypothetical protein
MSEARSQRAPWEESRPRSVGSGRSDTRFVFDGRSAEAVSSVVKRSVLRSHRAEPKLCGVSAQRKLRERAGNARGAGKRSCTGGRSRSDASRVLLVAGSKGHVAARRALAGRKLEAPPDAGHEQREGEPVRGGTAFPITGTRAIGLWVSARRLTRRRKAFSGTHVSGPHRQGTQGPSAHRSTCMTGSERNPSSGAHRAVRRPTRACLGVTTRMSEVDAVR